MKSSHATYKFCTETGNLLNVCNVDITRIDLS